MKKTIYVLATLTLTFALSATAFARGNSYNSSSMMGRNSSYRTTNTEDYSNRNNYINENFGYSMMNGNNGFRGMSNEDYDAMNKFMEDNFGYSMMNGNNGFRGMSSEDYDTMNKFMEDNFGYSMMNGNYGDGTYRSCHDFNFVN